MYCVRMRVKCREVLMRCVFCVYILLVCFDFVYSWVKIIIKIILK
jgi:hypothetical protein